METRFLLDTCAVIKYLNNTFPIQAIERIDSIIDEESNISMITKIELLSWNPPNPSDLDIYMEFINKSNVIFPSEDIANQTIQIRKHIVHNFPMPS